MQTGAFCVFFAEETLQTRHDGHFYRLSMSISKILYV